MKNKLTPFLTAFLISIFSFVFSNVGQAQSLNEKTAGRAPGRNLSIKKSKVPSYNWGKSLIDVPRLDVGQEKELEASINEPQFPAKPNAVADTLKQISPLTPNYDANKMGPLPYKPSVEITSANNLSNIPEVKELKPLPVPEYSEPSPNTVALINMKDNDYRLLEALTYLEIHKHYPQALALLADLTTQEDVKYDALYHYALSAYNLGINVEFRHNMFRVARESKNKQLQTEATEQLAEKVEALALDDMKELDGFVNKFEINITSNPDYNYFRAKYFLEEGNLGQVEDALILIPEKSKHYVDSLLINGLYNYRRGNLDDAIYALEKLLKETEKENEMRPIAAVTLGRLHFQKANYKEAYDSYLKVDKSNPLWLQAMVETAWTQILMGDYEGAAGNMFTLHTDFFKHAFAPESYVVRSAAYLNLCQFGDGAAVSDGLKRKYEPFKEKLLVYKGKKSEGESFYETVRTWLKNSDMKEVDGIPRSFIAELARSPAFIKVQTLINNSEDEMEKFNQAAISIIQREKELIKLQSLAKEEIAKLKTMVNGKNESADIKISLLTQERKLASYQTQYQLTNKARNYIRDVRERAIQRLEKEKKGLRVLADKSLRSRFASLLTELDKVLDQNEILQYELYSGAGEHMRYQLSGGEEQQKNDAQSAARTPANDKDVKWKFKGEIWEDEVGHFRSSLKNICPKEN